MSLNLEQVIGGLPVVQVLTLEDSDVYRITLLLLAEVIIAKISSCFGVLQSDHIS
jgi:hypothetical protein